MRVTREALTESTKKAGVAVREQSQRSVYSAGAGRVLADHRPVGCVVRLAALPSLAAGRGACRAGPRKAPGYEGVTQSNPEEPGGVLAIGFTTAGGNERSNPHQT